MRGAGCWRRSTVGYPKLKYQIQRGRFVSSPNALTRQICISNDFFLLSFVIPFSRRIRALTDDAEFWHTNRRGCSTWCSLMTHPPRIPSLTSSVSSSYLSLPSTRGESRIGGLHNKNKSILETFFRRAKNSKWARQESTMPDMELYKMSIQLKATRFDFFLLFLRLRLQQLQRESRSWKRVHPWALDRKWNGRIIWSASDQFLD